ncbi:MAG: hypothetical protein NZ455_08990 [Bacteroidia bacterium]|nr:hypothetical protein [Bacteroidia bacterium]MDW8346300.1 hypothetical protein [Bacteroidia bacterium]
MFWACPCPRLAALVWARSACYGLTALRPAHPMGKGKSMGEGLRTVLTHALRMPHAKRNPNLTYI